MERWRERGFPCRPDYWLLAVTFALLAAGVAFVYSAAMAQRPDNPNLLLFRQGVWALVGICFMAVAARVHYRRWQLYTIPMLAVSVLALIVVLIRGEEVFGGTRWVVGGSGQPSELMKLTLIIYVAHWLSTKGDEIREATYGLIPFSLLVGFVTALVLLQPDFSTAMLIAGVAMVMFFVAGAEIWQLGLTALIGVVTVVILVVTSQYRVARVLSFQQALKDPLAAGYHVRQTVIALGSGGLVGRGLGSGVLKFGHLPAVHTDSIFAVIGEELGFLGCLAIIGLFVAFAWRGYRVAFQAEDPFGSFLAGGLTTMIVAQAALNVAVATATVPFTGVPLPFISAGGSSLVVCLVAVGILFNISGHRVVE